MDFIGLKQVNSGWFDEHLKKGFNEYCQLLLVF